jgi:2'-5' RNA ligase
MMDKTHQTAIVLSPPENARDSIQAIRKQHDRNFRRWMPHVTLVYPFRPKDQFDDLAEAFAEACRTIEPFDVTLNAFQFFQHGRRGFTMWLGPEPKDAVGVLQEALWKVVPDCDEVGRHRDGFTPHLSVGQLRRRDELDAVLQDLQADWTPLTFRADRVDLIWRLDPPDDVFSVGYSIGLGTGTVQRVKM